jgi:hypothetical protein
MLVDIKRGWILFSTQKEHIAGGGGDWGSPYYFYQNSNIFVAEELMHFKLISNFQEKKRSSERKRKYHQ